MTALAAPPVAPRPRPDDPRPPALRGHRYARVARLHIKKAAGAAPQRPAA